MQNILTCDMRAVIGDAMRYSCLLTPQGQVLHDFFVFADEAGGYFLDVDAAGKDDLARRLTMYKLRSKVNIENMEGWNVYASRSSSMGRAFPDPRLPDMGFRIYRSENIPAELGTAFDDSCISLGLPPPRAIRVGKDYISDLNLDLLNAVSFDKGCFVGQELTARMKHRGLIKRRLLIVEGEGLAPDDRVLKNDVDMGEVRAVDSTGRLGLAVLKLEILQPSDVSAVISQKDAVHVRKPPYMLNKD